MAGEIQAQKPPGAPEPDILLQMGGKGLFPLMVFMILTYQAQVYFSSLSK